MSYCLGSYKTNNTGEVMDFDIKKREELYKELLELKDKHPIRFYERLFGKLTIKLKIEILFKHYILKTL